MVTNKLMTRLASALCGAALLFADGATAQAQGLGGDDQARAYADCMAEARSQPEEAFERALAWESDDGGEAARHCAAVALLGLGQFGEAATRLEALAQELSSDNRHLQADVLAQAGQAWFLAADNERAHAVQSAALELAPKNPELWVDRAITLATAENYWEAIDDLNEAHALAPEKPDILVMRASAYRFVDAQELSMDDITRALSLDPDHPGGLLERGILRRLAGDDDGAREDWLRVLALAEGSPVAEAAQANLQALDLKVE